MRLAVYGQLENYTSEEIFIDMIYYIERGVVAFDFLSYGDFEIKVAQAINELKKQKYPDIFSIIFILDKEIEYNKNLFDVWATMSPDIDVQEFIEETIQHDDFHYPQKLD